jgi:2-polyprenyl-3-methyl-5-hydroxy-6-metoxy-1,4-benzoquinol methylase
MEFNTSYTGLRNDLVSEITGTNKIILDVGCATGTNGKYLLDKGIAKKIYGIEIDPQMAEEAQKNYEQVFVGSLDDDALLNSLNHYRFDAIICGDVLEHLDNPWNVLKHFGSLLNINGIIIISLPNIQHIDVLIHLHLKNTWPVNTRGIFDKTHKRFFTFSDVKNLVASAGLKIIKVKRNFRFRDRLGSRFPLHGIVLKKLFKRLYTFQFIIVCTHQDQTLLHQ